ncbi:MAG: diaminopimelate epimerase [Alteromonadaceae bacterium]|nr:MAG: diaminopimelate epimerase [Alteromonadaceae bacterium]
MHLRFTKMHGLGNDFVMIDGVSQKVSITHAKAKKIADRNEGIGCDQVLVVEPPTSPDSDFRYRIYNSDGSEVENCGNGARCFAIFVRQRNLTTKTTIRVDTAGGPLTLKVIDNKHVTVNMGEPEFTPSLIPFNASEESLTYPIQIADNTTEISAISMGNPHSVAIVDNVDTYPVERIGPIIESHPLFPKRVNAGFMEIISPTEVKLRVFERGVGETRACGTGACAAMVAGRMRNLLDKTVKIHLPGGHLSISWEGKGHPVMMTGPTTTVFHGQIRL